MVTVSLCMIVKNEEEVLRRVLESVKDAVDEIIIVDTGSTDKTKEIAKSFTNKIFDFQWINDFSAARNFAYEKATMDYQMWLDADDFLPEAEKTRFLELKRNINLDVDMVTMKYNTHFDDSGNPILTSTRERLTKRENNYKWADPVHECIPMSGNIIHSDITISHMKPKSSSTYTRNLDIYTALESTGAKLSPRQQYYFARELKDHRNYAKSAYYFNRFLDEGKGWSEDNIASCYNLSICYNVLQDYEKVLPTLLRSFQYDSPRAEICCEVGYYYKNLTQYAQALEWFQLACKLNEPVSLGFILRDYWGYIPYIESCVCCCYLGRFEEAKRYNDIAESFKPGTPAVEQNKIYLTKFK